MRISVITVTLNCGSTIERTIKSVISQQNTNYEFIIIDGKSTDGTCDIIEKYMDNITYYVSEPDQGIYYAMNKGIVQATGDYLIFLNGDDYFVDDTVLARIKKHCTGENIVIGSSLRNEK